MTATVKKDKAINLKDLINIGIFTAVYFVIFMISTMTSYIPIMIFAFTIVSAILAGIPMILFLSRVKKFGMVSIMSILLGIIIFVMGYGIWGLGVAVTCGVLADILLMAGKWKTWKGMLFAYVVISLWPIGAIIPIMIMGTSYFEGFRKAMGDAYVEGAVEIFNAVSGWLLPVIVVTTAIAAVLGAFLGKAVLKKHFVRAGIV